MKRPTTPRDATPTSTTPAQTITVEYEKTGRSETIHFDELEVRVPPFCTNKHQDEPTVYEHPDGTKTIIGTVDPTPSCMWFFFESGCLVCLVSLDNLPTEYTSRKYCCRSWPCHVLYRKVSCPIRVPESEWDVVTFSDGRTVTPMWENIVLKFNPALRGTNRFFEPLEQERHSFSLDEERDIRAIALRGMTQSSISPQRTIATKIMDECKITRPQAREIVLTMVNMGATSPESAKPEEAIMKEAGLKKATIAGVFSPRSGDKPEYPVFRKYYIKNTGTRKGLYYLKLS